MIMTTDIFMSVGRTATRTQARLVAEIETYLIENGLIPHTIGRDGFRVRRPLKHIRDMMAQCAGTIVIAFERIHIQAGTESRGGHDEQSFEDVRLPTVWNQIEAGMAYVLDHPVLVIAERGLRQDGLLEPEHDWYINWLDVDIPLRQNPQILETISDWKEQISAVQQTKEVIDV
jgi:hypothetical protein